MVHISLISSKFICNSNQEGFKQGVESIKRFLIILSLNYGVAGEILDRATSKMRIVHEL